MMRMYFAVLLICSLASPCVAQISFNVGGTAADEEAWVRLRRVLRTPISIHFDKTPLHEAVRQMRPRLGGNVLIDTRALEDFGIGVDTPVTATLQNVTVRSALRAMLKQLDLTFMIQEESLVITTPEEAELHLHIRLYPVRDLIAIMPGIDDHSNDDYDSLIEVIKSSIEPESWDDVGGPGAVEPLLPAKALVISQTLDVHEQVEQLIVTTRRVRQLQGMPVLELSEIQQESEPAARRRSRRAGKFISVPVQWRSPQLHGVQQDQ